MPKCDSHDRNEQELRDLWMRIENCEQDISSLREAVGRGEEKTKTLYSLLSKIEKNIETLIQSVDSLRLKPARRWDTIVTTLITGGVGALIGYIITILGRVGP